MADWGVIIRRLSHGGDFTCDTKNRPEVSLEAITLILDTARKSLGTPQG